MNAKLRTSLASAGLVASVVLGGFGVSGVAGAQTSTTTTPSTTTTTCAPPQRPADGTAGAPGDRRGDRRGDRADRAAAVAGVLGMSAADLKTALATKTLAQIATEKNVPVQKVIDAIVAQVKTDHPDAPVADVTARVTSMVNGVRPTGGPGERGDRDGRGGRGGRGFEAHAATVAGVLGMSAADLKTAMATKSLAQIATEKNVPVQKVIDALVAEEKTEHPDIAAADLTARVTAMVNGVRPAGGGRDGDGCGPRGREFGQRQGAPASTTKA